MVRYTVDKILESIQREDYDTFSRKVYEICNHTNIDLALIAQLLTELQAVLTEYNCSDDMDDYTYLKPSETIPMCAYFVLVQIKKLISDNVIIYSNDTLIQDRNALSVASLVDSLNQTAEEDYNGSEILDLFEEVMQEEMNPLQYALLDSGYKVSGFTLMHIIYYLRTINTIDELRQKQFLQLEDYTQAEMLNECAKKHHTSFCYFFLNKQALLSTRE